LSLSDEDIAYQQNMFFGLGSLKQRHPVAAVANMSAAKAAAKLVG
jgi:NitT/TauT family transport system substrate-binding protein